MTLHGQHLLGSTTSAAGTDTFTAVDPATGEALAPAFHEATADDVQQAIEAAASAFAAYREQPPERIAAFLEAIAAQIMALGDDLLDRAQAETGLPNARLTGERGRTVNQARLFAAVVRDGSWVDARIDRGQPDRLPVPKPDIRRMLIPIGPVVVFGASNFPLAFSVAGGDTVSALAAGCPVVVKAHPAHPGTSELVGRAIRAAVAEAGMPEGVFSMVQGAGHEVGLALVRHPFTKAVGFTGSLRGGRALFDAAADRPEPIPVYAEMGSTNPVFLLPGALAERGAQIAKGYVQSVSLGAGQFCTSPGLVVGLKGATLNRFVDAACRAASEVTPATMLYAGILSAYENDVQRLRGTEGVRTVGYSSDPADATQTQAGLVLFATDAATFEAHPELSEEVFGPASIIIEGGTPDDLERIADRLEGHLTATLHGTPEDLAAHRGLVARLEQKVGRLIFNGFPTGVEVCAAMHHGGPYPATTDVHFTSVGTAAILRFARPICYQDFPDEALPEALQNRNPRGLWRLVDRNLTRDAV